MKQIHYYFLELLNFEIFIDETLDACICILINVHLKHIHHENFKSNIRLHNSVLFFAFIGTQIVDPTGYGPYCFRVHGLDLSH